MSNKKKDKSTKVALSFGKLSALLLNKGCTLASIYCNTNGEIHFIEARTPKIQKTFIISIPSKYKMLVTSDTEHYKTVTISKISGELESRQLDYISEVKGPLLDCDLLSISSEMMCLCKNNTEVEIYKFGSPSEDSVEADDDDENMENLEEQDPVEKIIKSAKRINKKIGDEDLNIPEEVEKDGGEEGEVEQEDGGEIEPEDGGEEGEGKPEEEEPEEEVTPVELEFMDEEGKLVDEKEDDLVTPEGDSPSVETEAPMNEELKKEVEEVVKQPRDPRRRDNSLPENIEDVDISLGIIYYSVEIASFNKKLAKPLQDYSFEDEVITAYDTIDDNECDIRNAKLDEVVEMAAKLALKAKDEVEKSRKEELNLKTQILKLSAVLDHCEQLKRKMVVKPEKYVDVKPEIERLYKQTKTTLYEMNVEILRNKDKIDEILVQYQTSLEELLDA